MKNMVKVFVTQSRWLCAIAAAAVIVLGMAACGGGGGGGGGGDPNETPFFVSGKFTKSGGAGTGDVFFQLADASSFGKAVVSDSYAVSGVIEDGDLTIKLSGTYDPVRLKYSASAAGSLIRYTINGGFDSSGASTGATATLAVKNGENWVHYTFVIFEQTVSITGAAEDSIAGDFPTFALGYWKYNQTIPGVFKAEGSILVSQWGWVGEIVTTTPDGSKKYESMKGVFVEVTGSGVTYDMIYGFPVYETTDRDVIADSVISFLASKGIKVIRATDSDFENYYNKPVDPDTIPPDLLSNPIIYVSPEFDFICVNFTEAQFKTLEQYYISNALEQYLISQNATPVTKYEKQKLVFSSNNTRMTMTSYGVPKTSYGNSWFETRCDTITEAKNLTTLDTQNPATMTR